MTEEQIKERFEEVEEAIKEYEKQLTSLKQRNGSIAPTVQT
jgi:hypothetical protein